MLNAPLRYFLESFKTMKILGKEKPDVVFVQNPPVFAVLIVWLYCGLNRARYVVDTHSGAFTYKRWASFLWLYRFLARRATMNILHNEALSMRVAAWDAPTIVLDRVPFNFESNRSFNFGKGFNVVVVNTFGADEPTGEVLEAARRMPFVNFYVTGHISQASYVLASGAANNVTFTDYLPDADYAALLKGSDVVICLTNHDDTMQHGALEALALGRPLITSNWPLLQRTFAKGTLHVDNTSTSLIRAIKHIRANYSYYEDGIMTLREEFRASWSERVSRLLALLEKRIDG
jgi:glycosyltransferase involved in cell wall biosynthesis